MESEYIYNFTFPWWLRLLNFLTIFMVHLYFILWALSVSPLAHLLIELSVERCLSFFFSSSYSQGISPLSDIWLARVFLPACSWFHHSAGCFLCSAEDFHSLINSWDNFLTVGSLSGTINDRQQQDDIPQVLKGYQSKLLFLGKQHRKTREIEISLNQQEWK